MPTIHTQRGNACAAEPCKNGIPQHTYTCGARCWRRLTLHQQTPWHELHHTSTRDERVAAAAVADTRVHHLQAPTPAIREHGGRQIAGSRYEQSHKCCHQLPAVACKHPLAQQVLRGRCFTLHFKASATPAPASCSCLGWSSHPDHAQPRLIKSSSHTAKCNGTGSSGTSNGCACVGKHRHVIHSTNCRQMACATASSNCPVTCCQCGSGARTVA